MTLQYDQSYTDYQTRRSSLRKMVRGFYLAEAASLLSGPTVDFGCGPGDLLALLPAGSIGLEINPASIVYGRNRGLDVRFYDADADDWQLGCCDEQSGFGSLVISHVLEHLEWPILRLNTLLRSADRLGIRRVLAIVPGQRGYTADATHRTYVDRQMLTAPDVTQGTGFVVDHVRHFPVDLAWFGNVFTHNELMVRYAHV